MFKPMTALLALALILCTGIISARIRFMPLAVLTAEAEVVAIIKVGEAKPLPKPAGSTIPWMANQLQIEKVLKGEKLVEALVPLHLPVFAPGAAPEDEIELPPRGQRAIVFLYKEDSRWMPVNGLQGVWPLNSGSDTPIGCGTGHTLQDVMEAIAKGN